MNNILLTGARGFLGRIAKAEIVGNIITAGRSNSDLNLDLAKDIPNIKCEINLVIHAAGKAHSVPKTESEKREFFDANVKGTKHLLQGLETSQLPKSFVFISSVAVYGKETGNLISETEYLLALDPYGLSKIQAEELVQEWCLKNSVKCSILRLPLLAGPNPPGNLKAMINGIKKGYYWDIAGGRAKKSIVLAEDVARIIPKVAEIGGIYNLTDGYHPSFSELSLLIAKQLGKSKPKNIPTWLARVIANAGDLLGEKAPINSNKLQKITSDLTFDDSKARKVIGWNPTPVLEGFKIF